MFLSPIIFLGLVGIILALFGAVVYLAYSSEKNKGQHQSRRSDEVLVAAEREAEEIVKSSVEKAQETLMDASYIKDDLMRSIESSMRSIAESAVVAFQEETQRTHKSFRTLFEQVADEYKKETQKSVASLEHEAEEEAASFRKQLKKEIIASQQKADARAEEAFAEVKNELEAYKQEKMRAMDAQIKDMVGRVFSDVLGKSLSSGDHEELVMQALGEAKESGVLSFVGRDTNGQVDGKSEVVQNSKNERLGATKYNAVEQENKNVTSS